MSLDRYPENDEATFYFRCASYWEMSMGELFEKAQEHFGQDISLYDLEITSEYIHTRCIGYDLYDPSDYDCYLVIRKK